MPWFFVIVTLLLGIFGSPAVALGAWLFAGFGMLAVLASREHGVPYHALGLVTLLYLPGFYLHTGSVLLTLLMAFITHGVMTETGLSLDGDHGAPPNDSGHRLDDDEVTFDLAPERVHVAHEVEVPAQFMSLEISPWRGSSRG